MASMLAALLLPAILGANDIYSAHFQPLSVNGIPYPGAQRQCMTSGGTWPTNAQAVYLDAAQTNPAPNPVVADGNGRFPTVYLHDGSGYKFVFLDANSNTLFTDDSVFGSYNQLGSTVTGSSSSGTAAVTGTNSGSGAGGSFTNSGTGVGVLAQGVVPSPTRAPLYIVPQNNLPSGPSKGEVTILSTTGLPQVYDGTYWGRPSSQIYGLSSIESEASGTSAANFTNTFSLPASSLIVGEKIHLRIAIYVSAQVGAPALAFTVLLNSTQIANTCNDSVVSLGDSCVFDIYGTVSTAGVSGNINFDAIVGRIQTGSPTLTTDVYPSIAINTTTTNTLQVQYVRTGATSATVQLVEFIVEES